MNRLRAAVHQVDKMAQVKADGDRRETERLVVRCAAVIRQDGKEPRSEDAGTSVERRAHTTVRAVPADQDGKVVAAVDGAKHMAGAVAAAGARL